MQSEGPADTWHRIWPEQLLELLFKQEDSICELGSLANGLSLRFPTCGEEHTWQLPGTVGVAFRQNTNSIVTWNLAQLVLGL